MKSQRPATIKHLKLICLLITVLSSLCYAVDPSKTKQTATAEQDAISYDGQEIYNMVTEKGIENFIIMGVHLNLCVLGRPFAIRRIDYLGMNVVLCRDLTDTFHRDPGHHCEGIDKVVDHVEKYWYPTITSTELTGRAPFKFEECN